MAYLDMYTQALTAKTAAHLLRRTTFGPNQAEIASFTGKTATQAVQLLIQNCNYNPPPPVDLNADAPSAGQPFLENPNGPAGTYLPFVWERNFEFGLFIKYWWMWRMVQQTEAPSLLEKLTLFWQNHFVTTREVVDDYRFVWSYLKLLRSNALGNFRELVIRVSKEPAMLNYLNGDKNEAGAGKANENYARELQELFTVGAFDYDGKPNYTEDDVKAAARVLTGWNHTNRGVAWSTTFTTTFTASKHDTGVKTFSAKYKNKQITVLDPANKQYPHTGEYELQQLVDMLLGHSQTPRFICRKLYRWYVNTNVTPDIETNVIIPLANLFVNNNYSIQPVLEKLLTSQIFYAETNIGCLVKSPADLLLGSTRFFNQPIPDRVTKTRAHHRLMDFLYWKMRELQFDVLDQPSVFGYEPFYQTGYSKLWINSTTLGLRNDFAGALVWRWFGVETGYAFGVDVIALVNRLQPVLDMPPNDTNAPASIISLPVTQVLEGFLKNLFALELPQSQKDFLIDKIIMRDQSPRTTWDFEWNRYRRTLTHTTSYTSAQIIFAKEVINWRLTTLLYHLLRMAEFHLV
jgi:uncharacterized protein (DUF1800 family)